MKASDLVAQTLPWLTGSGVALSQGLLATQDDMLETRFSGQVEAVVNFMRFVAREVREIMAELGVKKIDDIIAITLPSYPEK